MTKAIEIIKKHLGILKEITINDEDNVKINSVYLSEIIKAMEEYAELYHKENTKVKS